MREHFVSRQLTYPGHRAGELRFVDKKKGIKGKGERAKREKRTWRNPFDGWKKNRVRQPVPIPVPTGRPR